MIQEKISVLMAVYNTEKTISKALDSVLAQTYQNWQFIICDDCSTDLTLQILEDYSEKYKDRFIIIKNEINSKLAFSLNRCLEYADGEYCVRMDGDDYITRDKFEKQINFLKEHQDLQLCGTLMQAFSGETMGKIYKYKEYPDKKDLRFGPVFPHATIMMYTKVYKSLGGYTVSPRTARTQDYDLWFKFYAAGYKGAVIQDVLYYVREDINAIQRRKPRVYLWAIITRWIGFKSIKMPLCYYPYIIMPIIAMIKNELKYIQMKLFIRRLS